MPKIPASEFALDLTPGSLKAAQKAAGATTGQVLMVPPANIEEIEGYNVRVDTPDYEEHIADLKNSIRENGFYPNKPLAGIVAKDGDVQKILLTDGYSRMRAVRELIEEGVQIEAVPLIVKPESTLEDLTVALVQDNEGRPLTSYERAIVCKRLANMGLEMEHIAKRIGRTERQVSNLLLLADAPAKVRNMVISGKVSATEAVKQLRKSGGKAAEKIEQAVKKAASEGKTKATATAIEGKADNRTKAAKAAAASAPARETTRETFSFKQGAIVPAGDIRTVARVGGGDWWNYVDENTKADVIIEETVEISVEITREAKVSESGDTTSEADVDDTFDAAPENGQEGDEAPEAAQDTGDGENAADGQSEGSDDEL